MARTPVIVGALLRMEKDGYKRVGGAARSWSLGSSRSSRGAAEKGSSLRKPSRAAARHKKRARERNGYRSAAAAAATVLGKLSSSSREGGGETVIRAERLTHTNTFHAWDRLGPQ